MKTTLAEQVAKLLKTYDNPKDPRALVKAIEGLVSTHVELRDARGVKELAEVTCLTRPKHKSSRVVCGACFDAVAYPQVPEVSTDDGI